MGKTDTSAERMQIASRLRQIRENGDFTQEQFSEMLGISLSAYKKIESGENQVSLSSLRKLYNDMSVSADFILFGKNKDLNEIWDVILNLTEMDKMFLFTRLFTYFTDSKKGIFSIKEEKSDHEEEIQKFFKKLRGMEKMNAKESTNN